MKISITAANAVITTTLTAEQISKAKKADPNLLKLQEAVDGNINDIYAIDVTDRVSSINRFGASFTKGVNDTLSIVIVLPSGIKLDDAKALVYEQVGKAADYIAKIEEQIITAIPKIEAAEARFFDSIKVEGIDEE